MVEGYEYHHEYNSYFIDSLQMNHMKNFTSETNLLQPISGNKAKSVASPQMENIIILAYEEKVLS